MVIKRRMLYVWAGIVFVGLFRLPCPGQAEPGAVQDQKAKAAEAAGKITPVLDAILTQVNESKQPAQKEISAAQSLIDSTKRYFPQMDDKQKAQYCLLQSWLGYFSGQTETAHANAVKAWKLDDTSGDMWVTQVAMALVAGKKPMLPRPEKKPARPQRNRQPGGMEGFEMGGNPQDPASQIQPGKLNFDMTQFLAEAIDKKLEPMELRCLNGTTFDYKPGEEAVCVLFWQKYETPKAAVSSNEPNRAGAAVQRPAMPPMMEMGGMYEGQMMEGSQEATPTRAFRQLFRSGFAADKRIKFLAINLDSAAHKEDVVEEMIRQPQAWAQVLAADQASKSFPETGGISPEKPVLMMADSTGTVRYAGPARGFIAPMLLNTFLGKSAAMRIEIPAVADPNSLSAVDSNSLSKPAPAVQAPASQPVQTTARSQSAPKELSEEDKIMAERKLAATRDLFMQLGKKAGLNYARGVKFCREIIKDYPDSEYADEARKLMLEIPENERSRYNITDAELGL